MSNKRYTVVLKDPGGEVSTKRVRSSTPAKASLAARWEASVADLAKHEPASYTPLLVVQGWPETFTLQGDTHG